MLQGKDLPVTSIQILSGQWLERFTSQFVCLQGSFIGHTFEEVCLKGILVVGQIADQGLQTISPMWQLPKIISENLGKAGKGHDVAIA